MMTLLCEKLKQVSLIVIFCPPRRLPSICHVKLSMYASARDGRDGSHTNFGSISLTYVPLPSLPLQDLVLL